MVAAVRSPATATELAALQAQFPAAGGSSGGAARLHITTLDVASPDSIQTWAAGLQAACPGLRHCDVVINNAGVVMGQNKEEETKKAGGLGVAETHQKGQQGQAGK